MKEKVLITGASGFVGYHLIKEALRNDMEVVAAVRKSSNIKHLSEFDIQYTDLAYNDPDALIKDIQEKKYTFIIHAAGVTRARTIEEYNTINAEYTLNLAKAAVEAGVDVKKFVLVSSLAAIGPLNNIDGVINEETTPNPVTAYGASKLLAEQKLKTVTGLNYTILRPTAVYGPRDTGIFIFFKQLSKRIEGYIGRAEQRLSFIYVTDLASACISALKSGGLQAYNLSDGKSYTKYDLGTEARKILTGKTFKFHIPVNFMRLIATIAEKVSNLKGEAPILNREKLNELTAVNWICSIGAASKDMGFAPQYDLNKGVKETINWYKQNNWL
ncbi:NAD-dependent epimerase/dehydratase family protein [Mucilaginibacter calamicampi]|uniref:NAD-dependent epimerase/dehydratase family protein n=1 Tax=Mucilaginibacter calamicampi TaxID=1302352 RepID=A0ABW2YWV4_9SPHI